MQSGRERRAERRRVRDGDTYQDGEDVELEEVTPDPDPPPEDEQVADSDQEGGPASGDQDQADEHSTEEAQT